MWALHTSQYLSFMEHYGMAAGILLSFAFPYSHFCPLQRVSIGARSLEYEKEREPASAWVEIRATWTGALLGRFRKTNGSSEWGCWERVRCGERGACPAWVHSPDLLHGQSVPTQQWKSYSGLPFLGNSSHGRHLWGLKKGTIAWAGVTELTYSTQAL